MRVHSRRLTVWLSGLFCICAAAQATPSYTISGFVLDRASGPVAGITIAITNGTGSTVTDANGAYSFVVPHNWDGMIWPSQVSYHFVPSSKNYAHVRSDLANENYTAWQPQISGTVTKSDGTPLQGVTLTCSSGRTAVTNAAGYYELFIPYNWASTVSASLAGYSFTTKNYPGTITTDQTNQNFVGFQPKISGYVTKSDSTPLPGALITASGVAGGVVTSGYYEIIVPYNWSGTLSASLSGYSFTPKSYSYLRTNQTNQNFTGFQPKISGYVRKANGTALYGATVTAEGSGNSVTTSTSGYFEIIVPYAWSGTLSATLAGYGFTPKSYTNVTVNLTNQNFSGFQPMISGSTTRSGATVIFSGLGSVTSTPSYSFVVPYGWTGTVQVTLSGYHFPESPRSYTNVTANQTAQNFTAFRPSISGSTVRSGVTVTAVGVGSMVSNPAYSISVPYGWSGSLTATLSGYSFLESPRSYSNVTANLTDQNFTPFQPRLSGYVTKSDATPLPGATVSAASQSIQTDPNGFYQLTVPYNWSGSVTVTASGWGVVESPRSYLNVTTDLSDQNFTAFQPVISGTVSDTDANSVEGLELTAAGIGTVLTDEQGGYTFVVPYNWSGTITPAKPQWGFSPASRTYSSVKSDQAQQNFTVFQPVISGVMRYKDNAAAAAVEITGPGVGTVLTDEQGGYRFNVPFGWSGTITASKTDWAFDPASRTYSNVQTDQLNQNYTVFQPQIRILFQRAGQTPIDQVLLTISGREEPILCGPLFDYTVPGGWSGTLTPAKDAFTFQPAIVSLANVQTDKVITFTGDYQYPAGDGTLADPYQIWSDVDLYELSQMHLDWTKHFILMADIDLGAPGAVQPARPIGNPQYPFKGSFEGNHHTISHLTFTSASQDYVGLFGGVIPPSSTLSCFIKDLGLVEPHISTNRPFVGALAGLVQGYGSDSGQGGANKVIIENCYVTGGTVQGDTYVGGLIGASTNSRIIRCLSDTAVSGMFYIGGFLGTTGYSTNIIDQCCSLGNVSGDGAVGGFIGYVGPYKLSGNIVSNCYAQGNVSGQSRVGGFVGNYYDDYYYYHPSYAPMFIRCYSAGLVTATGPLVGGFATGSQSYSNVALSCFWDVQTSGQPASLFAEGKTTEQMMSMDTFAEWGYGGVWTIDEGLDYPRLAWQGCPGQLLPWETYSGGSGTPQDPYLISTAAQLNAIGKSLHDVDKSFKLIEHIDMNDLPAGEFMPIGFLLPFTGNFDGDGYSISNLNYTSLDLGYPNAGLFAVVGDRYSLSVIPRIHHLTLIDPNFSVSLSVPPPVPPQDISPVCGSLAGIVYSGSIHDIDIINANVSAAGSSGACSGGLIGRLSGQVTQIQISDVSCSGQVHSTVYAGGIIGHSANAKLMRCTFSGDVYGGSSCGGLVGYHSNAVSDQCRATGSVSGTGSVGGLVGYNSSSAKIQNSSAHSDVHGTSNVGGLVGYSSSNCILSNAYARSNVQGTSNVGGLVGYIYRATITNCYSAGQVLGDTNLGGFIGYYYTGSAGTYPSTFTSCFWDAELDPNTPSFGLGTAPGVFAETTANMQTKQTYAGWDFTADPNDGVEDIWQICEGTNYPRLRLLIPAGDYLCPEGVALEDFAFFAQHWLQTAYGSVEGAELTGDGFVGIEDLLMIAEYWLVSGCGQCDGRDLTGEGDVNLLDLAYMSGRWQQSDYGDCGSAELTGDGIVDLEDLMLLCSNWLLGIE